VIEIAHLEVEERGAVVLATVTGELDASQAPQMGEQIAEAVPTSAKGLVVDFSALEFIDSSGVAMLFGLARKLVSRRQRLSVVVTDGEAVARVLEIVDFGKAARMHSDLDAALADAGR
jgi:anti-anti-sigma factor